MKQKADAVGKNTLYISTITASKAVSRAVGGNEGAGLTRSLGSLTVATPRMSWD